jgi:uncharacterized protein (TIGR02246 family)
LPVKTPAFFTEKEGCLMFSRNTLRLPLSWTVFVLAGIISGLNGWMETGMARGQGNDQAPRSERQQTSSDSKDESAIRAVDEAYVRDYNHGDSKALAAMFTSDAEVIEANGDRYQGRDLVEQSFAETFAASKGAKIALEIASIRFVHPEVAAEEGRSVVTPTQGAPLVRLYTVLFVKRDGRWLISRVREEPDPLIRPHDRLKELEWMIGEWIDEAPDAVARFDCRWSEDGNFLIRSFSLKWAGKAMMSGTQRIGWDPLARQIRSWEFDSEGGFGEGRWSRDGERWIVKHSAVRPEGTTVTATNIMTRVRPDMIRWASTERVLGGESIPEDDAYVLVRVPPEPHRDPKNKAASPTSPNTPRSSR